MIIITLGYIKAYKKLETQKQKCFHFMVVQKLMSKLKTPLSESRTTANKIFKWILKYRKENIIIYKKTFKKLTHVINKKLIIQLLIT